VPLPHTASTGKAVFFGLPVARGCGLGRFDRVGFTPSGTGLLAWTLVVVLFVIVTIAKRVCQRRFRAQPESARLYLIPSFASVFGETAALSLGSFPYPPLSPPPLFPHDKPCVFSLRGPFRLKPLSFTHLIPPHVHLFFLLCLLLGSFSPWKNPALGPIESSYCSLGGEFWFLHPFSHDVGDYFFFRFFFRCRMVIAFFSFLRLLFLMSVFPPFGFFLVAPRGLVLSSADPRPPGSLPSRKFTGCPFDVPLRLLVSTF